MAFHINDKKDAKKGGKLAKGAGAPGTKTSTKGKSAGGKKIVKTGGARGS